MLRKSLFALSLATLIAGLVWTVGCGSPDVPPETIEPEPAAKVVPPPEPEPEPEVEEAPPPEPEPEPAPKPAGPPKVVMATSHGSMTIELYADRAPETVENFLQYVDDKFYDGTIFHRVIPGFMIQGGGFEPGMREKTHARSGQERVGQRTREPAPHHCHGAHLGAPQRHRAVLHQPRYEPGARPRPVRRRLGVLRFRQSHRGLRDG